MLKNFGIVDVDFFVPETIVDNKMLEETLPTTDEWIREKIGVIERHVVKKGEEAASDLGTNAAEKLIERTGIDPKSIDLIICCTQYPDYKTPATACIIQNNIGAIGCPAFDMNIGCAGFVYGLAVAGNFIKSGMAKRVLLINVEIHSLHISWKDRTMAPFFGDGASATLLEECPEGKGSLGFDMNADGSGWDVILLPAGGTRLPTSEETLKEKEIAKGVIRSQNHAYMEGKKVYEFATTKFPESVINLLNKLKIKPEEVDFLIPHQANRNIIKTAFDKIGLTMDKTYLNLDKYGNCSSASVPIALREVLDMGKIKPGDTVVFAGFGVGLAWGSCAFIWNDKKDFKS